MPDNKERVDDKENWWESINGELVGLKKEMIERVFDKIKEKNKDDFFLYIGKKLVEDYLLDEWVTNDKIGDFFIWMGLTFLSKSKSRLKDFREKIKNTNTKDELDALEESIMDNLDSLPTKQPSVWWVVSSAVKLVSWAAVVGAVARKIWSKSSRTSTWTASSSSPRRRRRRTPTTLTEIDSVEESAKVWEAKEVPLRQRMDRLFPDWTPTKEKQMEKYITTITVPVLTADWKRKNLALDIHKKLANEYIAIFQEMYDEGIFVNPATTWGFKWRLAAGSSKQSHHSYWSVVDVNYDVNGGAYWKTDPNSPYFNKQNMVKIWKDHGFYWWWNWKKNDPMHFTYMNA